MGFIDKIFRKKTKPQIEEITQQPEVDIAPDELFVKEFQAKGGKFLYCTKTEEILDFLKQIFEETAWESAFCHNKDLSSLLNVISITNQKEANVFLTRCEHLITEDGSILFSSNQLKEIKLAQYPINFIVYATTSQLIHNKDKALTSIKHRFKNKIPTNISAIKDFMPHKKDPGFANYGNNNSKNLYLILLEDL
jgi:L-lactate utilization protein LutC